MPPLPLPQVADSEISIDSAGIRDAVGYFGYLAVHYRDINFDYNNLNKTLRRGDKFYPSPVVLIDGAMQGGNFSDIRPSLDILRRFAAAKIEFEKSVKVAGAAVYDNKTMIGLDRLASDLIDKFGDFADGKISRSDFDDFYAKYKNTEKFYAESLAKETGLSVSLGVNDNIFSRLLGFFGAKSVAMAQSPPLGGPVLYQTVCTCSFVGAILVGPPVGGAFALPPVFALFPLGNPTVGHYVLGLYSASPIPCLQYVGVACAPDPTVPQTLGPVIILGTS